MKNKIFALLSAVLLSLTGCLDDKSNTDLKVINPIVIDMGDAGNEYSLLMYDTLRINPLVYKIGTPDAELEYEWRIHSQRPDNTYTSQVIDSTMSCVACITEAPASTAYDLTLTVTDRQTGIRNFETFRVKVDNPFAEGLLVADMRDGQTSDVTLIVDRCFNSGIAGRDDTRIFPNVWSEVNGEKIEGRVEGMLTTSYSLSGSNTSFTVYAGGRFLRADHYGYNIIPEESDDNIFVALPDDYPGAEFRGLYYDGSTEFLNYGGRIWPRGMFGGGRQFGFYLYPSGIYEYSVTHFLYVSTARCAYAFDQMHNRLLFFTGSAAYFPMAQLTTSANRFDVNDLEDYEPYHFGLTASGATLFTRQKSTGKYIGLTVESRYASPQYDNRLGRALFDFSAAAEIENVRYFAAGTSGDSFYYATGTKVYGTSTFNINATVQWEAASGEEITGIEMWKDGGRIDFEDPTAEDGYGTHNSANYMLIVTTYNESTGEGKVTCIPVVVPAVGGLEQNEAYHRVFEGFGRIVAICQNKS